MVNIQILVINRLFYWAKIKIHDWILKRTLYEKHLGVIIFVDYFIRTTSGQPPKSLVTSLLSIEIWVIYYESYYMTMCVKLDKTDFEVRFLIYMLQGPTGRFPCNKYICKHIWLFELWNRKRPWKRFFRYTFFISCILKAPTYKYFS